MRRPKKTVTINLADYLSAGTYNVKVKSKGTDIRDSADSNSVECVVAASGYQVTVSNNTNNDILIYDGQNSSGTLLGTLGYEVNYEGTFTISSGYIYIGTTGGTSQVSLWNSSNQNVGNPATITEDCSLKFQISYY